MVRLKRLIHQSSPRPIKDQAQEARQFSRRAFTAFLFVAAALFLLAARYVYLQVISHEEFVTRSTSNQVRIVPVAPNRGLIYDRRGRPVAQNRPAYRLELVPEKVDDLERVIAALGGIIELPEGVLEIFGRKRRR